MHALRAGRGAHCPSVFVCVAHLSLEMTALFIYLCTQFSFFSLRFCKILQRWGRVCPRPSPSLGCPFYFPAGAVRSRAATRARGCAAASATEATVASRGEQGRAGVRAVRRAGFFDGLGQWACQEAAGREKLVKTPAPAQEVGVSRRRPLARAPSLRGSEFF